MAIRTELVLRLDNSPGSLNRLCKVLADEKVNVAALNLEASGTVHLVPDNPLHASGLLRGLDYAVEECEVLFVQIPNTVGAVTAATRQLATAGININYAGAITYLIVVLGISLVEYILVECVNSCISTLTISVIFLPILKN